VCTTVADVRTAGAVLRAAARTHPGRVRANNEDLPLLDASRGVFGVIDGIGGKAGGEVAAATARDVILQRLARPVGTDAERVREAIAIANNEIYKRAAGSAEFAGMGCVVTLAIVAGDRLTIGHVGDTRLYKVRPEGMRKLTRDHSPIGEREDAGELPEPEAMRHPRRHEVFRDVGTIYRDKDEREFVDVIEDTIEPDAAILLCSDGMSDMLPANTIAHLVAQHAGAPERVVEALVAAANDAGGRDNITVVYAEMPLFAERVRHGAAPVTTITETLLREPADAAPETIIAPPSSRPNPVARAFRAVVGSRAIWFAAGILTGVIGALALTAYVATTQVRGSRTLIVAADGRAPFATIGDAVAAARTGDVVRIEPGLYREQVAIADGVDLVARVPGTVTIVHDAMSPGPALAIAGGFNIRVSGIRIDAQRPLDVGVRVGAPAATLEMVELTGSIRQAIELSAGSTVTVRGSRLAVERAIVAVPDQGQATFVDCVLTRLGPGGDAAVSLSPTAHLVLRGNAFAGFGADIVDGVSAARRLELLAGNLVAGSSR
jgi:serine/threonine protein phosphatase PrpC